MTFTEKVFAMATAQLVWFEIPADDLHRAARFYGAVLNVTFEPFGDRYLFFKNLEGPIRGALFLRRGEKPTGEYPILSFGSSDCGVTLNKVIAAGGSQVKPKTKISDAMGYFCQVLDTEGNTIAFWSER